MLRPLALCALALSAVAPTASADLVISQYYTTSSVNKWIELFNAGPTAVNLSNFAIGLWTDANAEGYKTGAAPNTSLTLPDFSLASGGVYLLSHGEAGFPPGVVANLKNSALINFTGNDSFGVYSAGAYSTDSLVDAIGFTNTGNEGANKIFVRLTLDQGYSIATDSNVLSFPGVWSSVTSATVNTADPGTDARLGSTTLQAAVAVAAVPEPTAALCGSLLAVAMSLSVARRPAQRG